MRTHFLRRGVFIAVASLFGLNAITALAGSVTVYVGYADSLRPNAYFPAIWNGSPNTIFKGSTTPGTVFDAGAILIENNTAAAINVNDVSVSGFSNGATFDLWGTPGLLPSGFGMVLTQTTTNDDQFDTSDQLRNFGYPDVGAGSSGFTPANPYTGSPQVQITLNSVPTTFSDTGRILDTGGYDSATYGNNGSNFPYQSSNFPLNESLQFRPIGTTGVSDPGGSPPVIAPLPSSASTGLVLLAALGALQLTRRKTVAG